MTKSRRMGLNSVIFGMGSHEAGWRLPESNAFASTDLEYWIDIMLSWQQPVRFGGLRTQLRMFEATTWRRSPW